MFFKILKKCFSYFPPVKDKLHQVGGVKNFVIDRSLLESCKTAHVRRQKEKDEGNSRNQKGGGGSKKENRTPAKEVRWIILSRRSISKNLFLQKIPNIILE